MTRPTLVRADSIDLQEQNSPSAKDHTNHPPDTGRPAPHQAEALREVFAEAAEEKSRSPRVSREWTVGETANLHNQIANHDALAGVNNSLSNHLKQQDELAVAQNGGITGSNAEDGDMADAEGDDSMDDDMMDKISSSPSIDDGGYIFSKPRPLPNPRLMSGEPPPVPVQEPMFGQDLEGEERQRRSWPPRSDSLRPSNSPSSSLTTGGRSSSPFVDTPLHYPLPAIVGQGQVQSEHHHHQSGLYPEEDFEAEDFEDDYYYEDEIQEYADEYADEAPDEEIQNDSFLDQYREPEYHDRGETSIESYDDSFEQTEQGTLQMEEGVETKNFSPDDTYASAIREQEVPAPYGFDEFDEFEDDDDCEDESDLFFIGDHSPRFIDSGWGGECLQDLEDIDFEFVYALHTFIATVEGQANAQKGDTMVLLDDSNSYWWLVRVVKDGSIGYLPAEHIETPTERLARLNKHRNIDLSATMLGDQDLKSKNPLKKAIRRRNAKTVTFSAPTYVEASDNDYSSDEEDGDNPFYSQEDQRAEAQEGAQDVDETVTVEPLRTRDQKEIKTETGEVNGSSDAAAKTSSDTSNRSSSDMFDSQSEGSRSRNGTVRNTDSFFKDDSVETRKITITPALFRDDSSNPTEQVSADPKDLKQRPSLEKLDKDPPADKSKDDKKKKEKEKKNQKEKKPGMLSGLFKRGKDKKGRNLEDDVDVDELIMGKRSNENARSSPVPSKDSQDSGKDETGTQAQAQAVEKVQRQPSKLQKQPRSEGGSPTKGSPTKQSAPVITEDPRPTDTRQAPAPERPPPATSVQEPSMRLVQPDDDPPPEQQRSEQPSATPTNSAPPQETVVKESKAGAAVSKLKSAIASSSEPRPEKVKKAKSRQVMDEFDSSSEPVSPVEENYQDPYNNASTSAPTSAPRQAPQRPIPGAFPDSYVATPPAQTPSNEKQDPVSQERLSESPVQVSPIEIPQTASNPPPLIVDNSSQEEAPSPSPVSSPSPELVSRKKTRGDAHDSSTSSTATSNGGTWNDGSLREFFDDDGEIRDLLTVVYDKSGVVPVGRDHPMLGGLFKEEEAKLKDITNRLDTMLGDWLARKTARNQPAGAGISGGMR